MYSITVPAASVTWARAAFALLVSTQVGSYRTTPLSVTRHRMRPFHSTGSRPSSSTGRGSSSRRRRA